MLPSYVIKVLDTLNEAGYEAYAVGGAVRDLILEKTPYDFDITTSALPEEIISLFEKTVPTGISHGTVTVISDKNSLEITTFRGETGYSDLRHPDKVNFGVDVREDIKRRDFTMNSLLMTKNGEIIDLVGGKKDIENKIIRTVGEADKRFSEDALRMLRALRFAAVLGFEIEAETKTSIKKNYELLRKVSSERIREEFFKLIMGTGAERIIKEFIEVFKFILPELNENNLKLLNRANSLYEKLAIVFKGDKNLYSLARLKASNEQKSRVKFLINLDKKCIENATKMKLFAAEFGKENTRLAVNFLSSVYDDSKNLLEICEKTEKDFVTMGNLKISGEDIKSLGYKGKEIGEIKRTVLIEIAKGMLPNTYEAIMKRIEK